VWLLPCLPRNTITRTEVGSHDLRDCRFVEVCFAKTLARSVISDGLVVKANDNTKIVANTLKFSMTAIRYYSTVEEHQMRDLDQTTKQLCNLVRKYPGKSILPAGQGLP